MNHLGGLQWPDPGRKLQGLGPDGWTGLLLCEEYMLLARNFGCLEVAITRVTPAARIRNKTMVDFDTRKRGLLKILIMVLISFQFTRIWNRLREQCPRSRAVREAHLVGTGRTQSTVDCDTRKRGPLMKLRIMVPTRFQRKIWNILKIEKKKQRKSTGDVRASIKCGAGNEISSTENHVTRFFLCKRPLVGR
jgi:hypothetical protein